MTLALIALALLAVVIFAFVLEPIVRARGDRALLDSAALPEHGEMYDDDEAFDDEGDPPAEINLDDRRSGGRVAIDRPASSDAS